MKKILSLFMLLLVLMSNVVAQAAIGESGAYDPVTLDEIKKGTVIAFDSVSGSFNTDTYYVKILGEDDEEYIYELSNRVFFEGIDYTAEEISALAFGEITYVLKDGKVKYINPVLPDGLFASVEMKNCYIENDTIYAIVEFQDIVGEFKLIMAAYKDNALCCVESFDISYLDSYYELEMSANGGEVVKLFLWESVSGLVPLCEKKVSYIPTEYGYLLSVIKTDGENLFEIFTTSSKTQIFECAEEIAVNEEIFAEGNSSIEDRLEFSSESANNDYPDEINATYHQPIMYALNENGEVAHIDTVVSSVNKKISETVKNEDGAYYHAPYGYNEFNLNTCSIADVKVDSNTKVIFVPDDRGSKDKYWAYDSYRDAFLNNECYHYEAYGLSEENVASLVLIYKENNNHLYLYNCETMIVESKISVNGGADVYIRGYSPNGYSLMQIEVNDDVKISKIGKGDIIRYRKDNYSKMTDYMVWYDASAPIQSEPCMDVEKAIENRIFELSVAGKTMTNYPKATYRLQYGTVQNITLSKDGDTICVTPSIANDNFAMVTEGNGVVEWEIESSVKVFQYTDGQVLTQAELSDIIPGKTEVVAYSAQGDLRMLYIVKQPYISEKKIMIVEKGTETVDGCKITGFSEDEDVEFIVDATKEPVIEEVYAGKIIAYVPDGDTIKDIEIVYSMPLKPFSPEEGEGFISADTKETVVFGRAEYSTSKITINGVDYTTTDDTNYLLLKYVTGGANKLKMGIGKRIEMKNSYVLIRVKADNPTVICDAMIFQELN